MVHKRQFGFIASVDEDAKRESLFFQFKNIAAKDTNTEQKQKDAGDGAVEDTGTTNSNTNDEDNADDGVDEKATAPPPTATMTLRKGDEVSFDVHVAKNGKRTAVNIRKLPRGTLEVTSRAHKNACHGYVLMEPSHSTLSNTPNRQRGWGAAGKNLSPKRGGGRWGIDESDLAGGLDDKKIKSGSLVKEEGCLLLTKDPSNMFQKATEAEEAESGGTGDAVDRDHLHTHLAYKTGAVALFGAGSTSSTDSSQRPKRGDLVSFVKAKSGNGVRDIRVVTKGHATFLRGRLESIRLAKQQQEQQGGNGEIGTPTGKGAGGGSTGALSIGTVTFVAATEKEERYDIDLREVISCDPSLLKENEPVEGIQHEGRIFGVCRTSDLYLESKLGKSHKERPKLNLTVRKGLGGTIMAQSMMAKVCWSWNTDVPIGFFAG